MVKGVIMTDILVFDMGNRSHHLAMLQKLLTNACSDILC